MATSVRAFSQAGIVIGCYGMPTTVALNVAAIRHFNRDRWPILVHDDCTPAAYPPMPDDVSYYTTAKPMGHVGGDVNAFITGLQWAKLSGYKYLIKISQRFIFTQKEWVSMAVSQAEREDAFLMGQPAAHHGVWPWPKAEGLRSECVMLRVSDWADDTTYQMLRTYPHTPEMSIRGVGRKIRPDKEMVRWRQLGPSKSDRRGGVLWHDANPEPEYYQLAKELGVTLEGYHNAGWVQVLGSKYRL